MKFLDSEEQYQDWLKTPEGQEPPRMAVTSGEATGKLFHIPAIVHTEVAIFNVQLVIDSCSTRSYIDPDTAAACGLTSSPLTRPYTPLDAQSNPLDRVTTEVKAVLLQIKNHSERINLWGRNSGEVTSLVRIRLTRRRRALERPSIPHQVLSTSRSFRSEAHRSVHSSY